MPIHPETWEIIWVTSKRAIKAQFLEDSIMKNTCIVWTFWVICPPTVCLVKVVNHTSPILFKSISTLFGFKKLHQKRSFLTKTSTSSSLLGHSQVILHFVTKQMEVVRVQVLGWSDPLGPEDPGGERWLRMNGFYTPKNQRLERRRTNPSTQTRIFCVQLLVFQGVHLQWEEGKTH